MELGIIALSKRSQTGKDKRRVLSLVGSDAAFMAVIEKPGKSKSREEEGLVLAHGLRRVEFILVRKGNVVGVIRESHYAPTQETERSESWGFFPVFPFIRLGSQATGWFCPCVGRLLLS